MKISGRLRLLAMLLCAAPAIPLHAGPDGVSRVTRDGLRKEDLAWSPDGKRLACSYYHTPGRIGIGIFDPVTADWTILTRDPVERAPCWSPDGSWLAFVHVTQSGTDGELDIWRMPASGGERSVLVTGKSFDNLPMLSPDGTRLVYTATREKTQQIYVRKLQDGAEVRLTNDPSLKQYPRWSPDGAWIYFNSSSDGNFEIYRIPSAGGEIERLTRHPAADTHPAPSPDGSMLAWASLRDGNLEIYAQHLATGRLLRLTEHPGYDYSPAWIPRSSRLSWVSDRDGGLDVYSAPVSFEEVSRGPAAAPPG